MRPTPRYSNASGAFFALVVAGFTLALGLFAIIASTQWPHQVGWFILAAAMVWGGSIMAAGSLVAMPPPVEPGPYDGRFSRAAFGFARFRSWRSIGWGSIIYSFGTPFGITLWVFAQDFPAYHAMPELLAWAVAILLIGLGVCVILVPSAAIGLALAPAINHDYRAARYPALLGLVGVVSGAAIFFIAELLTRLSMRLPIPEWLPLIVAITVLPAIATWTTLRTALALRLLRRA